MRHFPPRSIVCLTEETVETLYLLGEEDRIVGVSGYAVRPPQVRREKPRVSAFTSANLPKILALEPDLVLAFSDLQAPIVAELIGAGIAVHAFNQRDIDGILAIIRTLGALVNAAVKAEALAAQLERRLDEVAAKARGGAHPAVYFEEWDEPLMALLPCGSSITPSGRSPHRSHHEKGPSSSYHRACPYNARIVLTPRLLSFPASRPSQRP
jgi:iron complex transport system substrate-binding protein